LKTTEDTGPKKERSFLRRGRLKATSSSVVRITPYSNLVVIHESWIKARTDSAIISWARLCII